MNDKFKNSWWNTNTDEQMKKANPDLVHIIGKNMDELHKMFPDAKVCKDPNCEFNDLDHAICMESEQRNYNDIRAGRIQVIYEWVGDENNFQTIKKFQWHNGTKWIIL